MIFISPRSSVYLIVDVPGQRCRWLYFQAVGCIFYIDPLRRTWNCVVPFLSCRAIPRSLSRFLSVSQFLSFSQFLPRKLVHLNLILPFLMGKPGFLVFEDETNCPPTPFRRLMYFCRMKIQRIGKLERQGADRKTGKQRNGETGGAQENFRPETYYF